MAKSWFSAGTGESAQAAQAAMNPTFGPDKFWLKHGEKKDIVFVDDMAVFEKTYGANDGSGNFQFDGHEYSTGSSFGNLVTCLTGIDSKGCPICQKRTDLFRKRYEVRTIVDMSAYKGKEKTYQFGLKLFVAKAKTAALLDNMRDVEVERGNGKGNLASKLFRVARTDSKSPNVGDSFSYLKDGDMKKLFAVANYKGKTLNELFDEAEKDSKRMANLEKVFFLNKLADGRLDRTTIPRFNYMALFEPRPYDAVLHIANTAEESRFGSDKKSSAKPDSAFDDSGDGFGGDNEIPF